MQSNIKTNEKLINLIKLQIDMGIEFSSSTDIKNMPQREEVFLFFEKLNKIEQLDSYIQNLLKNKPNDLILSSFNTSSKIMIIADKPDKSSKESKTAFSGSSLNLLRKMFGAINVSLDEISFISINFPNEILESKSILSNLDNFELIASRLVEIIKPLFIVNMCITNNKKLGNLKTKSEKFDIPNPSLIIKDANLKKTAWEVLKLLKKKLNQNNV